MTLESGIGAGMEDILKALGWAGAVPDIENPRGRK